MLLSQHTILAPLFCLLFLIEITGGGELLYGGKLQGVNVLVPVYQ